MNITFTETPQRQAVIAEAHRQYQEGATTLLEFIGYISGMVTAEDIAAQHGLNLASGSEPVPEEMEWVDFPSPRTVEAYTAQMQEEKPQRSWHV